MRSGLKWKSTVTSYWENAIDNVCEYCVRSAFTDLWYKRISEKTQSEVADIVENILDRECLWSTMFFDPTFASNIMERCKTFEPWYAIKRVPCTCAWRRLCEKKHGFNIYTVLATAPTRNIIRQESKIESTRYAIFGNSRQCLHDFNCYF